MAHSPERRKPESLRIRSITPSLTVNDLPKSLSWYTEVAGFTEEERFEHDGRLAGATVKAGEVVIFLAQDDFAKGKDRAKGIGMRLLLETVQDLDQLFQDVRQRGGTPEGEITERPWGTRDFTLVDPDGFRLTITEALPDA